MSLLVVSAAHFEAQATLELLEKRNVPASFFLLGVGPIHAARAEQRLGEASKGKDVIYVGSCGSFYPFEDLHLVSIDRAYWVPPCYRTGISDNLDGLYPPIKFPPGIFSLPKFGLPVKKLLCSPTISRVDHFDERIAKTLPSPDELVENMELYVCARALIDNARSVNVILAVTNRVGPEGRLQWKRNFANGAALTAQFVTSHISSFTSG
ncbi:MAG: hypothetical protein HYW48_04875 [Deltaproteobacteria bacterium]|nr:hypothetical protein [Deltaproteobacteria bacterium]